MSSPVKKVKQSSLSEFYKKVDHQALLPYYYQLATITSQVHYHQQQQQQTPINLLYQNNNQHDQSTLSSQLVASYIPDQHSQTLDIHSNKKPLESQYHQLQEQPILSQTQQQQSYGIRETNQNLFNNDYQNQSSQLYKRNLQDSEIDYNLSVQPEQIKLPGKLKINPTVNKFCLPQSIHADEQSNLVDNFMITPENSLLKSPNINKQQQNRQRYNVSSPFEINKRQQFNYVETATPQVIKETHDEKQVPNSEVIERLRFNHDNFQQYELENSNQNNIQQQKGQLIREFSPLSLSFNTNHSNQQKLLQKQQQSNQLKKPTQKIYSFKNSPQYEEQNNSNKKSQIISSDDDQDSSQLLTKIRLLQSQVSQLKSHKYQYAINQYRQQTREQLQKKLQQSVNQINFKYQQQQSALKKQFQIQSNLYNKSIEDINKYKKTYAIILGQLKQNKDKIQTQYLQKVQEVNKFKQRLINQWKRNSNEEIKKIINNTHTKHSIKLTNSIQKLTNQNKSKQKISPFVKQKPQSSIIQTK